MKSQFTIKDKSTMDEILAKAEYGTLALSYMNKPYNIPLNFVAVDDTIYFHGSKKGKKMDLIKHNPLASFSVVEPYSMIQSYFSSDEGLACPASQFFRSIHIEGSIDLVQSYDEKVLALTSLMKKLQPEGKYKSLDLDLYTKMIDATQVFKLIPSDLQGKVKLGQHLPKQRFEKILTNLKLRDTDTDKTTIKNMIQERNNEI